MGAPEITASSQRVDFPDHTGDTVTCDQSKKHVSQRFHCYAGLGQPQMWGVPPVLNVQKKCIRQVYVHLLGQAEAIFPANNMSVPAVMWSMVFTLSCHNSWNHV